MDNLKHLVYYHLRKGGSLRELADQHNGVQRTTINQIGSAIKSAYRDTRDHLEHCYDKVNDVPFTQAPDLVENNFPYFRNAITYRLKNDEEAVENEIWDAIKPYGVE